jgi:hypothetical protein
MGDVGAAVGRLGALRPLDCALVAVSDGAEDVADFDQRRGQEGVGYEIRHLLIGVGCWPI